VVPGAFVEDISTRLKVLIADDNPETLRNTRVMLTMNPEVEVVAIARNGMQAVDLAKDHELDLAILDINMPLMDGLTAFETMKQSNPQVACIVISAEKDNQTLRRAMSVGAREYLIKPFTIDELNLAVYKVGKTIFEKRADNSQVSEEQKQSEANILRVATEYAKIRRSDDRAVEVFEYLAKNPECELRWLRILAMVYVIRQDWKKLKVLAGRLEHHTARE
jgi:YesN/AraC family two-component response regulator